uniref:SCP domain-containing protein n=1 Tax=Meloidogyne floridensis TaxID=298350 RepID=A0A915NR50_9BILA
MTDPLRLTILRAHNNYRSQLAKGLVTDVTNKTLPPGKNIYKLVTEAVIGAPLSWWSEKDQCPINASKLHVTPEVFDKCGHMTTVAWSHTTQIGCGIQLCPAQDWCSGW